MSIVALSNTPPASPALSSTSFSSSSSHGLTKNLYRKPVPVHLIESVDPPAFTFNFSFTPPTSPFAPASNLVGSPSSPIQHLSLDSPCRAIDLSSPEANSMASSEDGYSSEDESSPAHFGQSRQRGGGMFGTRLESNNRYANPALAQRPVDSGRGKIINDPEVVQHLFGASLQRSRRNSPPDDLVSPPVETAEIAEMLIDAAPETEPDFRVALSQTVVGSRAMRKSESGSSRSSVHSARTGKEIKARRAAAAKAAYKDEFADMAEEDSKVQDLREDVPEDFLFETPVPEMPSQESELKARKKALRARARERKKAADDASDAMSIGTPSDLGVDGEDEEEHSVLDRVKKKPFSLHLSLPGSNHSSRSNSPIGSPSGLQIGSPNAIQIGSPQAMVRGASSPTGSALSAAALSPSLSLNSKLSSGYNVGPPLDLASAHMIFEESIPRICTPEPTAESDAGHFKFDFLHTKPEVKSAPMYQTRHKHSSSSPGFGLKELREMRQAADLIERDAKRPTHSRSSSIAEKKLRRKPVPQQEGDELEVKVDTTKAAGGYFNAGFTFPKSKTDGPHNIVVSIGHESSTSARTSSESFESSTYPQTPDEFGMLSPVNRFGRRGSVSLSEMDNIAAFSSTSIEVTPPPVLDSHDDLSHAFDRVSFSPAGRPSSPHPLVGNESTPPASSSAQTSFFDAVSSSHSKRRHQRAPSFSQSPPVPNIPSPDAREVTGAWVPYSERRLGEPGSPSNPYGVPAKKIGMRRKSPRTSPGPA